MAEKKGQTRKRTTASSGQAGRRTASSSGRKKAVRNTPSRKAGAPTAAETESFISRDFLFIVAFALMIFLLLSNFGLMGAAGKFCSRVQFGLFGLISYILPLVVFLLLFLSLSNRDIPWIGMKVGAILALIFVISVVFELFDAGLTDSSRYSIKDIYLRCAEGKNGGGVLAGTITFFLYKLFKMAGTILILIVITLISILCLTRKSLEDLYAESRSRIRETAARARERAEERRWGYADDAADDYYGYDDEYPEEYDDSYGQEEYPQEPYEEEDAYYEARHRFNAHPRKKIGSFRRDRYAHGVTFDTLLPRKPEENVPDEPAGGSVNEPFNGSSDEPFHEAADVPAADLQQELPQEEESRNDIHEVIYVTGTIPQPEPEIDEAPVSDPFSDERFIEPTVEASIIPNDYGEAAAEAAPPSPEPPAPAELPPIPEIKNEEPVPAPEDAAPAAPAFTPHEITLHTERTAKEEQTAASAEKERTAEKRSAGPVGKAKPHAYVYPRLDLLKKGDSVSSAEAELDLKNTALRLEETLRTFGVNVTITDISRGPAVTRYELLPEQGVKVSRIVSLQDDIKMHLAATDIRIEAPIPGKSAIGIEVPNAENSTVTLRDILESQDFRNFKSRMAFPVGKDIAGKSVVFDIAKMPHMLIAGATGSGKSVCINTIIMGILYKASPDEVKMIMIDPKIVELSVYNGIPHLLIPVVTEPKKAAAALAWAVAEMNERYRKFADAKVRDLKGYNEFAAHAAASNPDTEIRPLPQLLVIVDELADLMMVSANEVEESICRLAQLARAAGIHLIIATQRPSVDVITGLIKANMPSRIAFKVSSGVDSRTILDMVGAEKLLGKGDMLFYPQGYSKPVRVQGAFVSDDEVSEVVTFVRDHNGPAEAQNAPDLDSIQSSAGAGGPAGDSDSGRDDLFEKAGFALIEKDKASIGLLQRIFKIGFNRAARIMDQLAEAGVVSDDEGTKARKILMTKMEFEQYLSEQ